MSHICRGCLKKMSEDRKGRDQFCPKCKEKILSKKEVKVDI